MNMAEKKLSAWERKALELRLVSGLECENWNLKHPVGTLVTLANDAGEIKETKTRSAAFVADSGHAVCFFESVSGFYLLDRAKAKE